MPNDYLPYQIACSYNMQVKNFLLTLKDKCKSFVPFYICNFFVSSSFFSTLAKIFFLKWILLNPKIRIWLLKIFFLIFSKFDFFKNVYFHNKKYNSLHDTFSSWKTVLELYEQMCLNTSDLESLNTGIRIWIWNQSINLFCFQIFLISYLFHLIILNIHNRT